MPSVWLRLILLWIAGVDLRVTLLAVPPVLPLIHRDLGLTETGIAILTGLPVVLLAVAAVPGSFLIARMGARRTMILGIVLLAFASGLRGASASVPGLFAMTFLMGLGVAISQPAMPSLISEWLPDRLGLGTAVYVNGLLMGEVFGAALTQPLMLPLAAGRWQGGLALWAALVLASAIGMAWPTARLPDVRRGPQIPWSPDWARGETWRLGFLLGGSGAAYFGANAFMPDFLRAIGRAQLSAGCLTVLNLSQLPAPLLAGLVAARPAGLRTPFLAIAGGILGGMTLLLSGGRDGILIAGAGVIGFCAAFGLVLCLALPASLSTRGDVHRLSSGMFAIGYVYTFVAPLVGGIAWDLSPIPATAFLPVAVGGATLVTASLSLRPSRPVP